MKQSTIDIRLEYKRDTGNYPGNDEELANRNDFINTDRNIVLEYITWLEWKLDEARNGGKE
jgi:hypothetical protein